MRFLVIWTRQARISSGCWSSACLSSGLPAKHWTLSPGPSGVHVYEVHDDDPADVPQAKLIGYFFDSFEIGLQDGLLKFRFPTYLPVFTSIATRASVKSMLM